MQNQMRKLTVVIVLLWIIIGCAPLPEVPPALQYLNDNPDMIFGDCVEVVYDAGWGDDYIQQCTPDGYTLYQDTTIPIGVNYTGAAYSIRPRGAAGAIGYTLPTMRLDEGCYLVKVSGFAHVWGSIGDYWIEADWRTPAMINTQRIGRHALTANGGYLAVFVMDAPGRADYNLSVFLWLQFASATDDSFLTFDNITVEAVDSGYCADLQ